MDGKLEADPKKFPSGLKALSAHLNAMGVSSTLSKCHCWGLELCAWVPCMLCLLFSHILLCEFSVKAVSPHSKEEHGREMANVLHLHYSAER